METIVTAVKSTCQELVSHLPFQFSIRRSIGRFSNPVRFCHVNARPFAIACAQLPLRSTPCLIIPSHSDAQLCQLLLYEERPKMRQLPCAGHTQNRELNERPPHNPRVCKLRLIAELGFTFLRCLSQHTACSFSATLCPAATHPHEHLLPPDIAKPMGQVLHLAHDVRYFILVCRFYAARLADRHVEIDLHATDFGTAQQPAGRLGRVRRAEA